MKVHLLPLGAVIASAVLALGITFAPPAAIPRYTQVQPPQDSIVGCVPDAAGSLLMSGEDLTVTTADAESTPAELVIEDVETTHVVRGRGPEGAVVGEDSLVAPCQPAATSGAVAFPDAIGAQLMLTNIDSTEAAVDLTILGPDGEITGLGARDIQLAPGESRPVAISVIAEGVEGPVEVLWQTTRGRVVAAGGTVEGGRFVTPSTRAATDHLLPGVSQGGSALVVLSNPGLERATAELVFHSPSGPFTPQGGESVTIPARSAVAVSVGHATGGDFGSVGVSADQSVTATLFTGSGTARGVGAPAGPDTKIGGTVPGESTIQLTNAGTDSASVQVVVGDSPQAVEIPAGATASVPAGDAHTEVVVESTQPLVGAAVLPDGTGVVPLTSLNIAEVEPRNAELAPSLR